MIKILEPFIYASFVIDENTNGGTDAEKTEYAFSSLLSVIGYSRAVKAGPFVFVGGTTSVLPDKSVYGAGDSKLHDEFIWKKITEFSKDLHHFLMLYNL